VAYHLFPRRARNEAAMTEFAATEISAPLNSELLAPTTADSAVSGLPSSVPASDSWQSTIDGSRAEGPSELGADTLPAPAAEMAVAQSPTLQHIGRYALKGLLGEGGLGQVHEAWDPLLSRTVAVKTLHFDVATPSRVTLDAMILNEARAAASLSHPHIVTVHDAGLSARGVYIAMERLYGCDLRHRLAQGWRPTQAQTALLVRRLADALAYAHASGVVHCDIKPANIFMNRRDKPKLLDFGIARVTQSTPTTQSMALDQGVVGSPHYLAPEQLQGQRVDARTDIHALGVVMYELLTLRKAYTGDSVEQIAQSVLNDSPAPACDLRPGVSRTLAAIAAKAMERDPAQRYGSAVEMAHDLRRWIERHKSAEPPVLESARPRRPPPGVRKQRAARQPWLKRLGIAALTLLLCAGMALAFRGRLSELWAALRSSL
jgi:serine/threonine-protein kinase